jgi:hypothetical protein
VLAAGRLVIAVIGMTVAVVVIVVVVVMCSGHGVPYVRDSNARYSTTNPRVTCGRRRRFYLAIALACARMPRVFSVDLPFG